MENVSKEEMYKCQQDQTEKNNTITNKLSLLTEGHKNMAKQIEEFKKETKESLTKIESIIKEGFEKIEEKFVTKDEHKLVIDKVALMYKIMGTAGGIFLAWIIGKLLSLI